MTPELKMIDASYAEDLKDLLIDQEKRDVDCSCKSCQAQIDNNKMLGLNIVHNALIKMGLKETARQFTKLIKKI